MGNRAIWQRLLEFSESISGDLSFFDGEPLKRRQALQVHQACITDSGATQIKILEFCQSRQMRCAFIADSCAIKSEVLKVGQSR